MPDEKKFDPFKPQQPTIPGVSSVPKADKPAPPPPPPMAGMPETAPAAKPPILLIGLAAGVVLIVGLGLILWSKGSSQKAANSSTAVAAPPVNLDARKPANSLPVGPGPIATIEELEKPWSSKQFLYKNPTTTEIIPAMVVRLPGGDFWGFSLREPFGNCELEYVSSLEKIQSDYHYHATHPMVGDPCNHTLYDLLRYGAGSGSDGGLVRGEIAQGNGIRPPLAIEIRVEGKQVVAARIE